MARNGKSVSVRLDDETAKKLEQLCEETGKSQSEVIRTMIAQNNSLEIIDGSKIAAELHEIRLLLEKGGVYDKETKKNIKSMCDTLIKCMYLLFTKGGEQDGDCESN